MAKVMLRAEAYGQAHERPLGCKAYQYAVAVQLSNGKVLFPNFSTRYELLVERVPQVGSPWGWGSERHTVTAASIVGVTRREKAPRTPEQVAAAKRGGLKNHMNKAARYLAHDLAYKAKGMNFWNGCEEYSYREARYVAHLAIELGLYSVPTCEACYVAGRACTCTPAN